MIYVRILKGVQRHFPARKSEWFCALVSLGIGAQLLQPYPTFTLSKVYDSMASWANESTWGTACFIAGALRLIALIINGTFADNWYGAWSPYVRGVLAFLSGCLWFLLWLGIVNANAPGSLGLVWWLSILFLDIANAVQATKDARVMYLRARTNGRP